MTSHGGRESARDEGELPAPFRVLSMLVQARPAHGIERRAATRSWTLFLLLLLVATTLWLPHATSFSRPQVLPVLVVPAAAWLASLVGFWDEFLDRFLGLLALITLHVLVALTGGHSSIYLPLYLVLLIYGAMFYRRGRLLLTFALVSLSVVVPRLYVGDLDPAPLSLDVVYLGVGGIVTFVVYSLTARLRHGATTDALTGLVNRGAFWQLLENEQDRCDRYGRPYSVLLADVDHFKQVNDMHGHRTGDRVLADVARVLASRVRAADVVARYGGEEFAVLLPETGQQEALIVAESLRRDIEQRGSSPNVTLSIGVASSEAISGATADRLIQAADEALYDAKRSGRDRVASPS